MTFRDSRPRHSAKAAQRIDGRSFIKTPHFLSTK